MHTTRPAKITSPFTTLGGSHNKAFAIAMTVALAAIAAAFFLAMPIGGTRRFWHSYLASYCFILSIGVGCLFFVTIMHLTRAGWSVTVRRIAELYATCLIPIGLLFLPILIPLFSGSTDVYSWNAQGWSMPAHQPELAKLTPEQMPPLEQLKGAFLNRGFFAIRVIAYFVIWGMMAVYFLSGSTKQDESGDKTITGRMQGFSGPLMILFAATVVFASFDIEMTLSPLWFSTMFPVYFFAGSMLGALCTILLTAMYLQKTGRVTDEITIEHYHDLGKLMQGFTIFWGYIAFSQFVLIWYANIPEETFWYHTRFIGSWGTMSIVLVVGHLFVPFFLLMGRWLRRQKWLLVCVAVFILTMHWLDHYWLVMPQFDLSAVHLEDRLAGKPEFTFSGIGMVVDLACGVSMIAFLIAFFCGVTRNNHLVPIKDPRLGEALNHTVH